MQDSSQGSVQLALSVLRVELASPDLRTLPLGATLLESLLGTLLEQHSRTPSAEPDGLPAAVLGTLRGLEVDAVVRVCGDAAEARCPLVQALATDAARRHVAAQQSASWRQAVSGEAFPPSLP